MTESRVDRFLFAQREVRKERPVGVLYVTDLTKPCLRSAFWSIVDKRPYEIETLRIFEAGNVLEDYWVRVLKSSPGVEVLGTQMKARYKVDGLVVHGRVDMLCQHEDGALVAHEVKTAKTAHWLKEPKSEHTQQLQFYLNCLGLDWGCVDYLDKTVFLLGQNRGGEGEVVDRSFMVERDPMVFARLVARAKMLMRYWMDEVIPPAEPCWLCDYCLYSEGCDKKR